MIADVIHRLAEMEREKDRPFSPRPSSAGPERCIRQMVYHGLDFPKAPLPGRTLLVFDDGHWHEELTADWIRKSSFRLHSEQMAVDCRRPMKRGHIDGIITDPFNVDRLWEHKAINHFTFQRYWTGEQPKDYLTQKAVYLDALQLINPDLLEGVLLIKNKNTAQYMEIIVKYVKAIDTLYFLSKTLSTGETIKLDNVAPIENVVQSACDKFNSVLDYISRKTLPKRQYEIDHWRCEYCQYHETCWEGYEREFNDLKTGEMLPDEIADTVRYYKELGAHKLEMTKEYDDLRATVKKIMKDSGVRSGRAGEYICEIKLINIERIDKSLLSDKERKKATTKSFQERLNIKKSKGVSDGIRTENNKNKRTV